MYFFCVPASHLLRRVPLQMLFDLPFAYPRSKHEEMLSPNAPAYGASPRVNFTLWAIACGVSGQSKVWSQHYQLVKQPRPPQLRFNTPAAIRAIFSAIYGNIHISYTLHHVIRHRISSSVYGGVINNSHFTKLPKHSTISADCSMGAPAWEIGDVHACVFARPQSATSVLSFCQRQVDTEAESVSGQCLQLSADASSGRSP